MSERIHLVGLDPSFKTMGVALWTPSTAQLSFYSGKLQHCIRWIFKSDLFDPKEIICVVENPNMDSPSFKLWAGKYPFAISGSIKKRTIFGFKNVVTSFAKTEYRRALTRPANAPLHIDHVRSAFAQAIKHGQRVGKSQAAAEYTIDILRSSQIPVLEIKPSDRHRADVTSRGNPKDVRLKKCPTKTTRVQFEEYSGIKIGPRESNEHSRDAATLVVNKTIRNIEMKIMTQDLQRERQAKERHKLKNLK